MTALKEFNKEYIRSFPIDLTVVDDFPMRPFYGIEFSNKIKKIEFGGEVFYNTTGSKIHYEDYSGEVIFKQKVSATSVGALFKCYLVDLDKFCWNFNTGLSVSSTKLGIYETIKVFEDSINDNYKFTSSEFRGRLGTEFSYIINMFRISAFISTETTLYASGFSWIENFDVKLKNRSGDAIKPKWSGGRYGLKLGINLSALSKL